MSFSKKISAVSLSAALALSLASCSLGGPDTTYGAVIDGYKVPAGVFITMQMDAYYEAMSKTAEEDEANGGQDAAEGEEAQTEAETTPFIKRTIDGIGVREWINNEATKSMQEFVAVENKFDELGLVFEDGQKEQASAYLDSIWEYYGGIYEDLGVSEKSQLLINLNGQKKSLLFDYYYGEGGQTPVPEEEIRKYLTDNYARINYIEMPLKDGEGNLLKSEGKDEIKKMAEDYISRAKNGEELNVLAKEYNDYYDALAAEAEKAAAGESGEAAAEEPEEAPGEDAAAEEEEALPDNSKVISKGNPYPSADIEAKVFDGTSKTGDIFFVESSDGETYYVVEILDLFSVENYFDNMKDTAVHSLKDDEFTAMVEGWTANQNVVRNEAAYKRYKIEKFMD